MQTQQRKPNKDRESRALKHTTLRRRTTYLNLLEKESTDSSSLPGDRGGQHAQLGLPAPPAALAASPPNPLCALW